MAVAQLVATEKGPHRAPCVDPLYPSPASAPDGQGENDGQLGVVPQRVSEKSTIHSVRRQRVTKSTQGVPTSRNTAIKASVVRNPNR